MRAILPLLLLSGCAIDTDNFAQKFGRVSCEQGLDCELTGFDAYADVGECLPDAVRDWATILELSETFGCSLDFEYGRACLKAFRKASCEEVEDRSWETEDEDCASFFAVCGAADSGG